jgi:hypothetical protein
MAKFPLGVVLSMSKLAIKRSRAVASRVNHPARAGDVNNQDFGCPKLHVTFRLSAG